MTIDILITRFEPHVDDKRLKELITVRGKPLKGLESLNEQVAAQQLAEALKAVFIPNTFTLDLIKEILGKAQQFSVESFSTEKDYVSKLYQPPEREVMPICLTGLAGVGKSATVAALRKVLPGPQTLRIKHYEGVRQVVSYWYASARGKGLIRQLLSGLVGIEYKGNIAALLIESRRRAYADGITLVLLEEMQHINTGQGAARVTDILLTMSAIGPPMMYAANYSLVHRLMKRNSEDTHRLLSEPRVMLPDTPDCEAWHEYVRECMVASNDLIQIKSSILAEQLYRFTFGIKRLVVHLLKLAYLEGRLRGRYTIELQDLDHAFRSTGYSLHRAEVGELQRQALQRSNGGIRTDLKCPFDIPLRSSVADFLGREREQRVTTKIFLSSLNAEERAGLEQLKPELLDQVPAKRKPRPAIHKATEEEMLDAHQRFLAGVLEPSSSPTRRLDD